MICWHDAEHNRPAECGDHAGVVPAGLKRWCLNGQAEGGCVMTRLYAWLWQGCASLALAVLLVGLAAWGTSGVWAEEDNVGLQLPPLASDCGDRTKCTPCDFPCIDVCFGSGKCGPDHCRCVMNKTNDKCICVDK
jgi:hypothetical protein